MAMMMPAAVMTLPVRARPHLHTVVHCGGEYIQGDEVRDGVRDGSGLWPEQTSAQANGRPFSAEADVHTNDNIRQYHPSDSIIQSPAAHRIASRSERPARRYSTTLLRRKMW